MPTLPDGTQPRDLSSAAQRLTFSQRFFNRAARLIGVKPVEPDAETPLGQRDFGPLTPLTTRTEPDSPEQRLGPRQTQYMMGSNIIVAPRQDQQTPLTPFEQLRNLAEMYDVASMCIAARIEEVQGLDWAVIAKDKKQQQARQDDCDEVTAFWESPDRLNDFDTWVGMVLYDLFSIDAATLYVRPDRAGRFYGLDPVDGATIKPLIDDRGRTLAYQQVLYGYPFSEYRRPSADEEGEAFPTFSRQELLYLPRWQRTYSPYGFPPTERVIMRVNTALRKQVFDMSYFTEGNIPEYLATMPEGSNPEQVEQFEENFNALLAGNDRARRRIKFVPWGATLEPMREFSYSTVLDDWMMRITCASFGVPPNELGFTEDVNRSTGDVQTAVNERRGLGPLCKWLAASIFNPSTRRLGGLLPATSLPGAPTKPVRGRFDGLNFHWMFGGAGDDLTVAQTDQIYEGMGAVNADEVRAMRFGDVLSGPAPGRPQPDLSWLGQPKAADQTPADGAPASGAPVTKTAGQVAPGRRKIERELAGAYLAYLAALRARVETELQQP